MDEPVIDPGVEFEHHELPGGSWVDLARGWLTNADTVYEHLAAHVDWQQGKVWRYERWIEEPRMGAVGSLQNPHHPVLADAQRALQQRYRVTLDAFGLAYYRDNRDSVAMHRDRQLTWLEDTIVAIVTFGATRPFLVQPIGSHDRSKARDLRPASGDLMVFGGRFQADYLHGVPKVQHAVRGRISAQWRYTSKRGARDTNPGYYEPREFSKGRK